MPDISSPLFRFSSLALPTDAFSVVDFKGNEGVSSLFEFEINLVSSRTDIDLDAVLAAPACFRLTHEGEEIPVHGTLKELHLLRCEAGYSFFHAKLAPKLWLLTLTQQNQVFLDKSLPQILEELLLDGGLTPDDFEFRLTRKYPPWEYVCQFRESHYNFFARWLEREGAYYYFEHTQLGAKCVIADSKSAHRPTPLADLLRIEDSCASEERSESPDGLRSFVCRQRKAPGSVRLRDVSYLRPTSELSGDALVSETGRGAVYYYGENFRTPSEANALAKVRAEELKCLEKRFYGQSRAPFLRPGFVFRVQGGAPESLNRGYLLTQLVHRGGQTALLDPAIQARLPKREIANFYANNFCAIADDLQFRPERLTVKPRFFGAITARIDSAPLDEGEHPSDEQAEAQVTDALGRYKVILPFDESGRGAGKASGWVRRMTLYAGRGYGMRFPLRKGAEVVLGFLDGDPDRPYISGAMPVLEGQPAPDSAASSDQNDPNDPNEASIVTAGGNALRFCDAPGQEALLLASPQHEARLRLGAAPDESGLLLSTDAGLRVEAKDLRERLSGDASALTQGRRQDFALGGRAVYNGAPSWELSAETTRIASEERVLTEARFEAVAEQRSAIGQQSEIVSSHSSVRAETLEAAGACSLVRATRSEVCGAAIFNAGTELQVVERRIEVLGDEIATAKTRQETVGVLQREIGQLVERVEHSTQRAGALLRSARLAVDTAELHCDRSDIIMHG